MNLTKKRWIILIASCFINLCIGSIYALSKANSYVQHLLGGISTDVSANLNIMKGIITK